MLHRLTGTPALVCSSCLRLQLLELLALHRGVDINDALFQPRQLLPQLFDPLLERLI